MLKMKIIFKQCLHKLFKAYRSTGQKKRDEKFHIETQFLSQLVKIIRFLDVTNFALFSDTLLLDEDSSM